MPESLEDKLVVGISSRALFDLTDANEVFEQGGLSAYREYQREHEHDTLEPGTAFPLVRGLLAVNQRADERLVEVVILSRNDADTGMRVLRSVEAHGLDITRGVFRGGRDPYPLLRAMSCDVFLSAEPAQVLKAREQGVAAAYILPSARMADDDLTEVRIAFDGDAVLFDPASQQLYDSEGLDAFHQFEADHADEPMSPGPFRPFLDGLARIQAHFGAASPIRTALVTARAAPAHYRVVNTLRSWGVNVDETYFLGGVDKAEVAQGVRRSHLLRRPADARRSGRHPGARRAGAVVGGGPASGAAQAGAGGGGRPWAQACQGLASERGADGSPARVEGRLAAAGCIASLGRSAPGARPALAAAQARLPEAPPYTRSDASTHPPSLRARVRHGLGRYRARGVGRHDRPGAWHL